MKKARARARKKAIEESLDPSEDEEEEEDGPLAELRRRAPDVTITVVKQPGSVRPAGGHQVRPGLGHWRGRGAEADWGIGMT